MAGDFYDIVRDIIKVLHVTKVVLTVILSLFFSLLCLCSVWYTVIDKQVRCLVRNLTTLMSSEKSYQTLTVLGVERLETKRLSCRQWHQTLQLLWPREWCIANVKIVSFSLVGWYCIISPTNVGLVFVTKCWLREQNLFYSSVYHWNSWKTILYAVLFYSETRVKKSKVLPEPLGPWGSADLRFIGPQPDTSRSCKTMNTEPVSHGVPVYSPAYAAIKLYCLVTEACMHKQLAKVALDSAAARIEPLISSRKSNALATTPGYCNKNICST